LGATREVLTAAEAAQVDQAVDTALEWLAQQQQPDGGFPGRATGQPGITSLTVLAFLSAGHLPGSEPYGKHLERAVNHVLSTEREPGFFSVAKPRPTWALDAASHTAYYNQAITGLMLSEISGELGGTLGERVVPAIERALKFTVKVQFREVPGRPQDEGGWRYPVPCPQDVFVTDLSITAWQVTFLRSAKNAGFEVKDEVIEAAHKYVKGLYKPEHGTFTYDHSRTTRGMSGAGIMAMAMLGQHNTVETRAAAEWIRVHPFTRYGERVGFLDRFQYSVYYCSQAMYQLGGDRWHDFSPTVVDLMVPNQQSNGSWRASAHEVPFGDVYVTAISVFSLTPHYAMLPIHQR